MSLMYDSSHPVRRRRSVYGSQDDILSPEGNYRYVDGQNSSRYGNTAGSDRGVVFFDAIETAAPSNVAYFEEMADGSMRLLPPGSHPKGGVVLAARLVDNKEGYARGKKYVVMGNKRGCQTPETSPHGRRDVHTSTPDWRPVRSGGVSTRHRVDYAAQNPSQTGRILSPDRRAAVVDNYAAKQPWYQGSRNSEQLEIQLRGMPSGCFFIRDSRQRPDAFILAHVVDLVVHHWLVVVDELGVGLGRSRDRYQCLTDLVSALSHPQQRDLSIPLRTMRRVRKSTEPPRHTRDTASAEQNTVTHTASRPKSTGASGWRTLATFDVDVDDEEAERRQHEKEAALAKERDDMLMRRRVHELELQLDRVQSERKHETALARMHPPPPARTPSRGRGRPILDLLYPRQPPQRPPSQQPGAIHIHLDKNRNKNQGFNGDGHASPSARPSTTPAGDAGHGHSGGGIEPVYMEEITTTTTTRKYDDSESDSEQSQSTPHQLRGGQNQDLLQKYRDLDEKYSGSGRGGGRAQTSLHRDFDSIVHENEEDQGGPRHGPVAPLVAGDVLPDSAAQARSQPQPQAGQSWEEHRMSPSHSLHSSRSASPSRDSDVVDDDQCVDAFRVRKVATGSMRGVQQIGLFLRFCESEARAQHVPRFQPLNPEFTPVDVSAWLARKGFAECADTVASDHSWTVSRLAGCRTKAELATLGLADEQQQRRLFRLVRSPVDLPNSSWTCADVAAWLELLEQPSAADAAEANGLTGKDFVVLSADELELLGVSEEGARNEILRWMGRQPPAGLPRLEWTHNDVQAWFASQDHRVDMPMGGDQLTSITDQDLKDVLQIDDENERVRLLAEVYYLGDDALPQSVWTPMHLWAWCHSRDCPDAANAMFSRSLEGIDVLCMDRGDLAVLGETNINVLASDIAQARVAERVQAELQLAAPSHTWTVFHVAAWLAVQGSDAVAASAYSTRLDFAGLLRLDDAGLQTMGETRADVRAAIVDKLARVVDLGRPLSDNATAEAVHAFLCFHGLRKAALCATRQNITGDKLRAMYPTELATELGIDHRDDELRLLRALHLPLEHSVVDWTGPQTVAYLWDGGYDDLASLFASRKQNGYHLVSLSVSDLIDAGVAKDGAQSAAALVQRINDHEALYTGNAV
eukprot:m.1425062 g.1425062  ORF g.1425062 m.1425062 type:complete len:1144 (-) comp25064_c0_seq1:3733-7164(-)